MTAKTGAKRKRMKQLISHSRLPKVTEAEVKAVPFVTIQNLSKNLIKMPTKQSSKVSTKMLMKKTLVLIYVSTS